MSVNTVETWRVETPEGIFETDLETLKQWIVEGCVLPTDKVSKGNLNWIEAGRAPVLRRAFAGQIDAPSPETVSVAAAPSSWPEVVPTESFHESGNEATMPPPPAFAYEAAMLQQPAGCYKHAQMPPHFICRACGTTLCQQCPKFVSKVPICPLCGDLCKPFQEVRARAARLHYQTAAFGFTEFGRAFAYPFQHIFGLLFMAVVYAFFQNFGGLKGWLLASGILFGCMSHVISQFAWGRTDRGILPEFDGLSWWEHVIRPLFLSIGITIITFGPLIVLVIAFWYGMLSGSGQSPRHPVQMQPPVAEQPEMTKEELEALVDSTNPEKETAAEKVEQLQPARRVNTELEKQTEQSIPLGSMLKVLGISGAVIALFLLTLAWAFFYYPMALTIAGYTEDFKSVINPLVGLDTMRRMGWTYVKAFLMYLGVQIMGTIMTIGVAIVLAPFDMPFFGNLPAQFINGIITFYTSLVVACILGFALYKCADKLDIQVD